MSQWKRVPGCECISYARYIVPNFASNTVVLGNSVISPGADLLESFLENRPEFAESEGEGLSIVMPNAYHHLGVQAWLKRLPKATLRASEQAIERLEGFGFEGIVPIREGESGPVEQSQWAVPPGHRGGDVWLVLPSGDSWAWVTCDSFLNYPRMSNQPVARFIQKVMGAAPGLKISRVIKYVLLTDRAKFRAWGLDFISKYPPNVLMPSHGDPHVSDTLALELEALMAKRL